MDLPIEDQNILQLIPQRPPMVMVSSLISHSHKVTRSQLHLNDDNIFCTGGKFIAAGMLENIAQTAALRMGYIAKQHSQSKVPLGFIGAISKVKIHQEPDSNCTLETLVEVDQEIFGIQLIRGGVSHDQQLLCECEMKIVIKS